ncbi:YiiX/YebB-like N1pC/P60 family cysteine hydrolase [Bacteriovoracales bacterium]|nr:YiiX/YebB-like N1pC/P60 family cysteine hydrolase [Bacteriovoracales bacterium]
MKIFLIVSAILLCQALPAKQLRFQSIYKKSIFRLTNIIPEIEKMRTDGKEVYQKAVDAIKKNQIIDADLYEKINLTTAKILAVQSELEEISIDLKDAEKNFVKMKNIPTLLEVMALLSTHILMQDNYRYTLKKINKYKRLRKLINRGDKTFGTKKNELIRFTKKYTQRDIRKKIDQESKFYNGVKRTLPFVLRLKDAKFLDEIISKSGRYTEGELFIDKSIFKNLNRHAREYRAKIINHKDLAGTVGYEFVNKVSKILGNTILGYQWREGTLKKNKEIVSHLKSILRPLDIANSRIRNKVSSFAIPGFWTHNAIWIGTEKDLKDLGIWHHPKIRPYQKKIRSGASFLEADKPGVRLATIPFFLKNLDDVSLMRHKGLIKNPDKKFIKERILIAIGHVGKQYDFNFDFAYGDKIICSDVIHFSFPNVGFEIKKIAGRHITTPDVVAREGFEGRSFEIQALYIYGKRAKRNLTQLFTDLTNNKSPSAN